MPGISRPYSIALIGLGRVGLSAQTVMGPDNQPVIRNHLDALIAAGGQITALVDKCQDRLKIAQDRISDGAPVIVTDRPENLPPGIADLTVLATPPRQRANLISRVLELRPKAILIEKPVAESIKEASRILSLAQQSGVPFWVSFNRRTDPEIQEFANSLRPDLPKAALFRYGSGLYNYGSHAVDHILDWFGPVESVQSMPADIINPETSCVSFRCKLESGLSVEVFAVPDVRYDVFEAEIYYADEILGFRNNGVQKYRYCVRDDLFYPGYPGLVEDKSGGSTYPVGGFVEMYIELFRALDEGFSNSLCAYAEGLEGLRVLTAAFRSATEGGRIISLAEV